MSRVRVLVAVLVRGSTSGAAEFETAFDPVCRVLYAASGEEDQLALKLGPARP